MQKMKKIPYSIMLEQLPKMPKEELQRHLTELGCTYSYDKIYDLLTKTFNDLQIADEIFQRCSISDTNSPYTKDFIDEAVLEIAQRESFPFTHYGTITRNFIQAMDVADDVARIDLMEANFRKLMKLAKIFSLQSVESLQYQVNDGIDVLTMLAEMLDGMQQMARKDHAVAKRIVAFVDKYLQVFPKTNNFTKVMLQYEQAQAYIVLKSRKGEALFMKLLKTHSDPSDVILHYGLAYMDDDPAKTKKIFMQYQKMLDKKSEAYDLLWTS